MQTGDLVRQIGDAAVRGVALDLDGLGPEQALECGDEHGDSADESGDGDDERRPVLRRPAWGGGSGWVAVGMVYPFAMRLRASAMA